MRTPVRKWENRVVSKRSTFELDEKSATGKGESLEDSTNLAGLSSMPGFQQLEVSVPPAVKLQPHFARSQR